MSDRPLCEVCGKPEAVWGADEDSDALCWAEATGGGHSRQSVLEVLRATRRERDDARAELLEMDARLASLPVAELVAYGRAREDRVGASGSCSAPASPALLRVARDEAIGRQQDAHNALLNAAKRWREWCDEGRGGENESGCGT